MLKSDLIIMGVFVIIYALWVVKTDTDLFDKEPKR